MYLQVETETCKRIQARLSRKNITVSMPDLRQAYNHVVGDVNNPTQEEIETIYQNFLPTDLTITSKGEIFPTPIEQPQAIEPMNEKPVTTKGEIVPQETRYGLIQAQLTSMDISFTNEDIVNIDGQINGYADFNAYAISVLRTIKQWLTNKDAEALSEYERERQELVNFLNKRQQRVLDESRNIVAVTAQSMNQTNDYLRQFKTAIEQRFGN